MPILLKQPSEIFPVGVDFTGQLPVGALLATGVLTAQDASLAADATATFLQSTVATIIGDLALFRVQGGIAGHRYHVTLRVTLDTADILEEDVWIDVRDL